tara:strand:+ start:7737 stop:8300 length:564 start_codon:yes stop_codon:yes gene_type:complete
MDTIDIETKPRSVFAAFLPMAIALGACLLSVVALLITAGAKHKQSQAEVQLRVAQSQLAAFESRLSKIEAQSDDLTEMDDMLMQQMKSMADQVQVAVNNLGKEVISQGEILEKMQKAGPLLKVARQSKSTQGRAVESSPGTYTIQSGDTLGRLAQLYDVSLSDLLSANPEINPRRLQIGQQVVIPTQ